MQIALVQFDIRWNDEAANHDQLTPLVKQAADGGAKLVVLPEMFNSGFSFLRGPDATRANKAGIEFLIELSSRHSIAICGSLPEQHGDDKPFNTLYVAEHGEIIGSYRKLHLFSFGGETEKYRRGNELLNLSIDTINFSFFICYDLRFPVPFELLAPKTDAFVVVANWPAPRAHHWRSLLMARAIEQQAYVVGVNRIGQGGDLNYAGDSLCINPRGEVLCDGGSSSGVFFADIDAQEVNSYRSGFTALKDRIPGLYESLRRN